jgi:hypothetical protein
MNTEDRSARLQQRRLARELKTIRTMLTIYCRDHHANHEGHAGDALCTECQALSEYAEKRLVYCPFGTDKPTCVNCQIHCYGARQREAVRKMMRYAGPRMLTRHPVLALWHIIDGRRPAPPKPSERARKPE